MVQRIKAFTGLRRISRSTPSSVAASTRSSRQQLNALMKDVNKLFDGIRGITPEAVEHALRPTFKKSQRYCPIDTGALRASGELEVRRRGKDTVGSISYGKGGKPPYAAFVHERTDLHHAPPTRSKFLEAAIAEDLPKIKRRLRDYYRSAISG